LSPSTPPAPLEKVDSERARVLKSKIRARVSDLRRHLDALRVAMAGFGEDFELDAFQSAFDSAGQRCSALRVLCVQEDVADRLIEMLAGAIRELRVGDPGFIDTDVGPVIDEEAKARLYVHIDRMRRTARLIAAADLSPECAGGVFVAPHLFEIDDIARLEGEVFGPILHLVRYRSDELDRLVDAINATGYGLTLGIHSRIDATVERVRARACVGNLYVNRNQIGAVVGVQPFGGEGLSGTGPKAGGPDYLARFAIERVVSVNTAAAGGNAALLALGE
jgi:RHH-type transcriptional regulator, proline utilization regulon repressor / proline dehydrogenase / delta 1-pyrroline-5-carboxylate dehydrogenase